MEYFLFLSDLGRYPLVQTGYLIKGRFPFILRKDKSLGLEAGGWRQGPRPGGMDPDPRAGTQTRGQGPRPWGRNPGPGGRNLEAGRWSKLLMEYFPPTVCLLFSVFMFEGRK